jgi:predicted helicase
LDKNGGIIAFVSNGAWLDGNSTDGFRKSLEEEFSSIYVFNLRGNQRTSGELSRKEGGKIFGSGSRTPISVTLLVKNPKAKNEKATINYHDIGDYLNREEKLSIVKKFRSMGKMEWKTLQPNEQGDWIAMRNEAFENLIPIAPIKKFDLKTMSIFNVNALGIVSSRDSWAYNYSSNTLKTNIKKCINYFNNQVDFYKQKKNIETDLKVEDFIDNNPKNISWSRSLRNDLAKYKKYTFNEDKVIRSIYRPFCVPNLYFNKDLINDMAVMPDLFPNSKVENYLICTSGIGSTKDLSVLITNKPTDYQTLFNTQCFPLYFYEENNQSQKGLFDDGNESEYIRRDGISDFILERAIKIYGKNVSKEDIFYYVYGFLHSPEYREILPMI